MNIQIEKVKELVGQADLILIKPEAENVLLQLLDLKDQIEAAIDEAEAKIEEAALKINPNFKSIRSDNLKVFYREYGSRYKIDESLLDKIPSELYKKEIKYTPVPKAIDEWTHEHSGMPVGIVEVDRTKSLSFSRREKRQHETGESEE